MNKKAVGQSGEDDAASFLKTRGYRIVGVNVRPFPGMARGEIDIIAWDGPTLVFVEVKARKALGSDPSLAVPSAKRRQLMRLANAYLCVKRITDVPCRFDVVMIATDPALPCPMLSLIKDAFSGI